MRRKSECSRKCSISVKKGPAEAEPFFGETGSTEDRIFIEPSWIFASFSRPWCFSPYFGRYAFGYAYLRSAPVQQLKTRQTEAYFCLEYCPIIHNFNLYMGQYPSVIAENSRNRLLFSFRSRWIVSRQEKFLSNCLLQKIQPLSVLISC